MSDGADVLATIVAATTSGVITAADTAATVALGPWTICRDVPKIVYATSAANAV